MDIYDEIADLARAEQAKRAETTQTTTTEWGTVVKGQPQPLNREGKPSRPVSSGTASDRAAKRLGARDDEGKTA